MNISKPKSTMGLSKPKSALSTKSANVRKSSSVYSNQRAVYWNRRCQTAVYKPHRRMMEACSYHVVRQMELEVFCLSFMFFKYLAHTVVPLI